VVTLLVTNGPERGCRYALGDETLRIGRGSMNAVQLPDVEISRQHAEIYCEQGDPWIVDLGSANGTFVNGVRVSRAKISVGDRIRLGETEFAVESNVLQLLVLDGPDKGRQFMLEKTVMLLGRDTACDARLTDIEASRRHAEIRSEDGRHVLVDLGGVNGTYLNGRRLREPTLLSAGDYITLGNTLIVFGTDAELSRQADSLAPRPKSGTTELLTPADMARFGDFAEISEERWQKQFDFNDRAIVRRRFRAGEVICREGDYGSTAFYILRGTVQLSISGPLKRSKRPTTGSVARGLFGLFRRARAGKSVPATDETELDTIRQSIPIDAPGDLRFGNPMVQLEAGDLFGEMTCLNFYPRSATAIAVDDCELLEMMRNVLDVLKRAKSFKAKLERSYRERALFEQLRNVREFADLPDEFIDQLRSRVELLSFDPGEMIFEQDSPAAHVYMVRIGFVQVIQHGAGGDIVLGYVSRGQIFGEMGVLTGGAHSASCRAIDHVEVVQIKKEDFEAVLDRAPALFAKLKSQAQRRQEQNRARLQMIPDLPLDQFVQQGLPVAQNALLIDLDKCTRCDECVHACAAAHDDGITRLLRDGLRFHNYLVASACRHCSDPQCMIGCPVGSIRRRGSLEVVIEDWCIGCELCSKNCPYGNIEMHQLDVSELEHVYEGQKAKIVEIDDPDRPGQKRAVLKRAITCDLCLGLSEPMCVYACPHDAAIRVNPREFFARRLAITHGSVASTAGSTT
jgi:pSer/pThr/pTyr-binding forkhead associated (FHA) protein/CRP-like cAMP-binding protein/Pyruvate/2-oxoacid:ferredoxin oxidoreductase delta subunit